MSFKIHISVKEISFKWFIILRNYFYMAYNTFILEDNWLKIEKTEHNKHATTESGAIQL